MSLDAPITAVAVETVVVRKRSLGSGITCVVVGVLLLLMLTVWRGDADSTGLKLSNPDDFFEVPVLDFPALLGVLVFALPPIILGGLLLSRPLSPTFGRWAVVTTILCGILGFIVWAGTSRPDTVVDLTGLMSNTVFLAVPLVLGAIAGVVSERTGVINLAIEGQMLAAAFLSAFVATLAGSLLAGLAGGLVAGALVGSLLAVFAIRYRVDQVVLGVVINLLVLGLTTYLYSSVMQLDATKFNDPEVFERINVPVLSKIPVVGPLVFSQNLLVYIAIVVVILVHLMLYRSRWGLRTRSVGEHPRAADTLGINVNRLRFRNSLLAGAIAGLAGAYLTIGSVGEFGANMTAGRGFIALAAVIFGRWTPLGAMGAALLFSFATSIKTLLAIIGAPVDIPGEFLEMLPYLVTIIVVAGVVGRVSAPAADGVPYVKS